MGRREVARERRARLRRSAYRTAQARRAVLGPSAEMLAAVDLAGRAGGRAMEIGWDEAGAFYVQAEFAGQVLRVGGMPDPQAAAVAFAARVLDGGQCQRCGRLVSTDPAGGWARDTTLVDGRVWTQAEQAAAGVCVWQRRQARWVPGCEGAGGEGAGGEGAGGEGAGGEGAGGRVPSVGNVADA